MPVATRGTDGLEYVGVCGSILQSNRNLSILQEGELARASSKLGLPVDKMRSYREEWKKTGRFTCELSIFPHVPLTMNDNFELRGDIRFALDRTSLTGSQELHVLQTEAVCRPVPGERQGSISSAEYSFVVQIRVIGRMVDQMHPCLDIVVEPRALIENKLPIATITIRTPMPQTYSAHCDSDSQGTTHDLDPDKSMEIHTLSNLLQSLSNARTTQLAVLRPGGSTDGSTSLSHLGIDFPDHSVATSLSGVIQGPITTYQEAQNFLLLMVPRRCQSCQLQKKAKMTGEKNCVGSHHPGLRMMKV